MCSRWRLTPRYEYDAMMSKVDRTIYKEIEVPSARMTGLATQNVRRFSEMYFTERNKTVVLSQSVLFASLLH